MLARQDSGTHSGPALGWELGPRINKKVDPVLKLTIRHLVWERHTGSVCRCWKHSREEESQGSRSPGVQTSGEEGTTNIHTHTHTHAHTHTHTHTHTKQTKDFQIEEFPSWLMANESD